MACMPGATFRWIAAMAVGVAISLSAQNPASPQGFLEVTARIQLPEGTAYLFVNSLTWPNDWPQIEP